MYGTTNGLITLQDTTFWFSILVLSNAAFIMMRATGSKQILRKSTISMLLGKAPYQGVLSRLLMRNEQDADAFWFFSATEERKHPGPGMPALLQSTGVVGRTGTMNRRSEKTRLKPFYQTATRFQVVKGEPGKPDYSHLGKLFILVKSRDSCLVKRLC